MPKEQSPIRETASEDPSGYVWDPRGYYWHPQARHWYEPYSRAYYSEDGQPLPAERAQADLARAMGGVQATAEASPEGAGAAADASATGAEPAPVDRGEAQAMGAESGAIELGDASASGDAPIELGDASGAGDAPIELGDASGAGDAPIELGDASTTGENAASIELGDASSGGPAEEEHSFAEEPTVVGGLLYQEAAARESDVTEIPIDFGPEFSAIEQPLDLGAVMAREQEASREASAPSAPPPATPEIPEEEPASIEPIQFAPEPSKIEEDIDFTQTIAPLAAGGKEAPALEAPPDFSKGGEELPSLDAPAPSVSGASLDLGTAPGDDLAPSLGLDTGAPLDLGTAPENDLAPSLDLDPGAPLDPSAEPGNEPIPSLDLDPGAPLDFSAEPGNEPIPSLDLDPGDPIDFGMEPGVEPLPSIELDPGEPIDFGAEPTGEIAPPADLGAAPAPEVRRTEATDDFDAVREPPPPPPPAVPPAPAVPAAPAAPPQPPPIPQPERTILAPVPGAARKESPAPPTLAAAAKPEVPTKERAIVHLLDGQVRRGLLEPGKLFENLRLQTSEGTLELDPKKVQILFLLRRPDEPPPAPEGELVQVFLPRGRSLTGYTNAGASAEEGFFLRPRTAEGSTSRVFIYPWAIERLESMG